MTLWGKISGENDKNRPKIYKKNCAKLCCLCTFSVSVLLKISAVGGLGATAPSSPPVYAPVMTPTFSHRRRSSVDFGRAARARHLCPKYVYEKNNKMPKFYMKFAPPPPNKKKSRISHDSCQKMPEFFMTCARKIFSRNLGKHVPPPVSYAYQGRSQKFVLRA